MEAFGSLPFISQPKLSPDGHHFAVIQAKNGRPAVVIYEVGAPPDANPAVLSDNSALISDIRWASNDRLLVIVDINTKLATSTKMEDWYRTMSVDTSAQNAALMFKGSDSTDYNYSVATIADVNLDDPNHIFMPIWAPDYGELEFHYSLYRVDAVTGNAQHVVSGSHNTASWIMDGHGHVVARIDETKNPLVDHLKIFDNDEWREAGAYNAEGGHGAGIAGLTEDGGGLVQVGKNEKTATVGLSRLDIASSKESVLFVNPSYDIDEPLIDEWTGRVIGASFVDDKTEYVYFDPAMEALQKGLEAAFPGLSVHAVSWDTAKDKLIVAAEGPRQPLNFLFLDRNTHVAQEISSTYPKIDESDLGEMKPYPYKARDGLDIPAYLSLPPGKPPKNLPTVIFPHGGPGARDMMAFDWMAAFFANRGYAVLQPNFRGSTGYGVKFEEAGYGQWGLKMQDDVSDGVKKLIADGIADPKRICIVGASYGGYAALAGAAYTPDLYACAASIAGLSDLKEFLATRASDYGSDSWMISTWTRYIGDRNDESGKLDAASPVHGVAQIKCPILLMHGTGDTTVRINQSESMRDALLKAGKPVEFVSFNADTHYMELAPTRIEALGELEKFLAANIGN